MELRLRSGSLIAIQSDLSLIYQEIITCRLIMDYLWGNIIFHARLRQRSPGIDDVHVDRFSRTIKMNSDGLLMIFNE